MHRRRILELALSSSSSSSASDNEEAESPVFGGGARHADISSSKVALSQHATAPFVPSSPSPAPLPPSSSSRLLNKGGAVAGTTTAKTTLSSIITSATSTTMSSTSNIPNKPIMMMMNRSPPRSPTIEPVRDEEAAFDDTTRNNKAPPPPTALATATTRRVLHHEQGVESIVVTTSAALTNTNTNTAHRILKNNADDGDEVTATATNYTYPVLSPKTTGRGKLGGGEGPSTTLRQPLNNDADDGTAISSRAPSLAATETAHNGNSPILLRVEHNNSDNTNKNPSLLRVARDDDTAAATTTTTTPTNTQQHNKSPSSSDSESDDASSIEFTRMATTSAASPLTPAPATTTTKVSAVGNIKTTVATGAAAVSSAHTSSTKFTEMRSYTVSQSDSRGGIIAPPPPSDPTSSLSQPPSFNPAVPQTISVDPSLFKTPQRRTLVGKSMRVSTTSISEPLPTEKLFVVKSPTHYTEEELMFMRAAVAETSTNAKENLTGAHELAGKELHVDDTGANPKNLTATKSASPPTKTTIRKVVKKKVMVKRKKYTANESSVATGDGQMEKKKNREKKDRKLMDESDRKEPLPAATAARRKLLLGMKMSDSDSDSDASSSSSTSSSSQEAYEEEIEEIIEEEVVVFDDKKDLGNGGEEQVLYHVASTNDNERESDRDQKRTADSISVATTLFAAAASEGGGGGGKTTTTRGINSTSILLPTSNKYTPTTTPTIRTPVGEEETKEVLAPPRESDDNDDVEARKRKAAREALEQQLQAAAETRRLALLEKEKAEAEILLTLQRRQEEKEEEEAKNKKSKTAIIVENEDFLGSKQHQKAALIGGESGVVGGREAIDLDSHTEGEEEEDEEEKAERERREVENIRQSYVPTFSSYEKRAEVSLSSGPSSSAAFKTKQGRNDDSRKPRLLRSSSSSSSDSSSSSSPFILTKAEYHAAQDNHDASKRGGAAVNKNSSVANDDDELTNAVTNAILRNVIDTHTNSNKKKQKVSSSQRSSSSPIFRGGKDNDDDNNENEPLTVLVQKSAAWDRLRASQRRVEREVPDAHSDTTRLYLVMNRLMKAAAGDENDYIDDDEVSASDFSGEDEEYQGGAYDDQTSNRRKRRKKSSPLDRRAWGSRSPLRFNGTTAAKSAVTLLKDTSQMILYEESNGTNSKRNKNTNHYHQHGMFLFSHHIGRRAEEEEEEGGEEVVESKTSNGVYGKRIAEIVSENTAPRTVLSFSNKTLASAVADAARRANTNVSSGLLSNGRSSTDGLLINNRNHNNNYGNNFDSSNTTSNSLSKSLVASSDIGGKSEPLNASSAPLAAYLRLAHQQYPQEQVGKEKGLVTNSTTTTSTSFIRPPSSSNSTTAAATVDIASILERRRQRISQAVGQNIVGGGDGEEELSTDNNTKTHCRVGMAKRENGIPFIKTTTLFDDGHETVEKVDAINGGGRRSDRTASKDDGRTEVERNDNTHLPQNNPKSPSRLSAAEPSANQTAISSSAATTIFTRESFAPVKIIDDLVAADAAMQKLRDEEMRRRIEHIEEMKRLRNSKAANEQERLRKEEAYALSKKQRSTQNEQNVGHQELGKKKEKQQTLLQTNIGDDHQKRDTGNISPSSARTALSARRTRRDSQMIADTLLRRSNDVHCDYFFPSSKIIFDETARGRGKVEEKGCDEKNFGLSRHQQKTHIGVSDFDVRVDLFAEERGLERVLLGHTDEGEEALLLQQKRQPYALPITFSSSEKDRSSDDVHRGTSNKADDGAKLGDLAISSAHYTSTLAVSGLHARRPVTKKVGHDGIVLEYERDHTYPSVSMGLLSPTKKAEIKAEEKRHEEHLRVLAVASAIVREEKKKDNFLIDNHQHRQQSIGGNVGAVRSSRDEELLLRKKNDRPLPTDERGALIVTSTTTGHHGTREGAGHGKDRIGSVTRLEGDEDMDDLAARTAADLKALLALKPTKKGNSGGLYSTAKSSNNTNGQDTFSDKRQHQFFGDEAKTNSYYSDTSPSSSTVCTPRSLPAPTEAIVSIANDDTKPQSRKRGLYQELVEGVSTLFTERRTAPQKGSAHYELYEPALNNASRRSKSRSTSPPNAQKHSAAEVRGSFTLDAYAPTRGPSAVRPMMDEEDKLLFQNAHITSGGNDYHVTGMQQQQQHQQQRDREREREAYIKRVTAETLAAIAASAAATRTNASATSYPTSTSSSSVKAAVRKINSAESEVTTTTMRERDMQKINSDENVGSTETPFPTTERVKVDQTEKKEENFVAPKPKPATNHPSSVSSFTYSYATHRTTLTPTGGDLDLGIPRNDTHTNNNNNNDNYNRTEKLGVPRLEPLTMTGSDPHARPSSHPTRTDSQPKTPTAFEASTMSVIPTLEATKLTVTHDCATRTTLSDDNAGYVTSSSVLTTTTRTADLGLRRELYHRVVSSKGLSVDIVGKNDHDNALVDNLKLSASPAPRPIPKETFSSSHMTTNGNGFRAKVQNGEEKEKKDAARDEQHHFFRNLFQDPSSPSPSSLMQTKAAIHPQSVASPLLSDSDVGPMSLSATVTPPQPLLSSVLDVDQQRIRVITRRPPPAPTPSPPNNQNEQREQQYTISAEKKSESAFLTSGHELIAADRRMLAVTANAPTTSNTYASTASTSTEAASSISAATSASPFIALTHAQTALTALGDGRTPPPRRRVPPPPPTFD